MSEDSTPEKFRVFVPNPETELVIGEGANNFKGIMGRADKGGIFFGAGADKKSLPFEWSTYEGFKKAHTTIGIGVGGLASAALLFRSPYMKSDLCKFDLAINGLAFAAPTAIGAASAIMDDGTSAADGNISLYADKGIALCTPMSYSATGGLFASMNGSLTASVNAIGAASINGIVASVNGVYSATISGITANVIGDSKVHVSSRDGTTSVEGRHVEIGQSSGVVEGVAYKNFLDGTQSATDRVDIKADGAVEIHAGKPANPLVGAPTRLRATEDTIRAETKAAVLDLKKAATLHCGKSVMQVGEAGLKLFYASAPIKAPVDAMTDAAKTQWTTAHALADKAYEEAGSNLLLGIMGGLGAVAVAVPAAITTGAVVQTDAGTRVGATAAAGALGAAFGAASALGITKAIQNKLASKARSKAKKVADKTYKAALATAYSLEEQSIKIQSRNLTNPSIEVSATGITLAVGPSKLKITATGIEMETAPGAIVKVNGTNVMG